MVKNIIFTLFYLISFSLKASYESTFESRSFIVNIKNTCEEGEMVCDKVIYNSVSKKNGSSIHLMGKTINRNCNTSSCDMLGYEFKNGVYSYFLYFSGKILILKQDKVIYSEQGQWR